MLWVGGNLFLWEWVWKLSFVAVLILFAGMSVLVTIHGARDIRRMLKELGDDGEKPETK